MNRGVALVTGGSRGIGAAVARATAAQGWTVCLTYRTDDEAAAAVAAETGGEAIQADVAKEADVLRAFRAADELGPLTAMVANAGIAGPRTRVDELSAERIERMLAVNVLGAFLCCREAVRRMSTHHGGRGGSIVLVSSAASRLGSPGEYVDYAASKGAVDTLGLGLAREVAQEDVRVNVVRPGLIATGIHEPGRLRRVAPSVPMGRAGTPDEVAAAIVWLLGDEAAYTTGALLDVSGGR
jgi:NAD(P)-dependent dehydrogenase (short-subunit alcohol dehydrogenase family)